LKNEEIDNLGVNYNNIINNFNPTTMGNIPDFKDK
jgi:hypothetical protein